MLRVPAQQGPAPETLYPPTAIAPQVAPLKVQDVMTRDVVTVTPDTPVHEAMRAMAHHDIGGLPVVDEDGKLRGIVTHIDVLRGLRGHVTGLDETLLPSPFDLIEIPLRAALQRVELGALSDRVEGEIVADVMERELHVVRPSATIEEAAQKLGEHRVNRLPVVKDGRIVGIVTRGDLLRGLARDAGPGDGGP